MLQFVSLTGAERWITESSAHPQRSAGRGSLTPAGKTLKEQESQNVLLTSYIDDFSENIDSKPFSDKLKRRRQHFSTCCLSSKVIMKTFLQGIDCSLTVMMLFEPKL